MFTHKNIFIEPKDIEEVIVQIEEDMNEISLKIEGLKTTQNKLLKIKLWLENIQRKEE